jgi:hypothetical protein
MPRWTSLAAALAASTLAACGSVESVPDARSLTSTATVSPGADCPNGGQQILSGVDVNGNGILDAGEVLQTAYVCSEAPPVATCTTWEGDFVVGVAADWKHLADMGCTRVAGVLRITAPGVAAFDEPSPLTRVGGLWIDQGAAALERLSLPALTAVDADLKAENVPALADLDLPALVSVGGDLNLFMSPALTRVNAPELASAGGVGLIGTNVAALALPRLATAAWVNVVRNPVLASLSIPALTATQTLDFSYNPLLATLEAPSLRSVGSYLWGYEAAALTRLSLPELT